MGAYVPQLFNRLYRYAKQNPESLPEKRSFVKSSMYSILVS